MYEPKKSKPLREASVNMEYEHLSFPPPPDTRRVLAYRYIPAGYFPLEIEESTCDDADIMSLMVPGYFFFLLWLAWRETFLIWRDFFFGVSVQGVSFFFLSFSMRRARHSLPLFTTRTQPFLHLSF